jgi:hypothetical protein
MLTTESIPPLSSPHRLPKEKMLSKSLTIGDIFTIKTDHFPRSIPAPSPVGGGGAGIYIDWCITLL